MFLALLDEGFYMILRERYSDLRKNSINCFHRILNQYMARYCMIALSMRLWGCSDTDREVITSLKPTTESIYTRMHSVSTTAMPTTHIHITPRRLFTTSTTTTPRPLSEDELVMSQYCSLLQVSCDKIGLSGSWFTDMMNSFEGKNSLKSVLTLLHKKTRKSLGAHVSTGLKVPHCGLSRILAALTAMYEYQKNEETRDVGVYLARQLVSNQSEQLCDFSVYMFLDTKLLSDFDREVNNRLNLRLLMFAAIEPRGIKRAAGAICDKQDKHDWGVFASSLNGLLEAELNEAIIEYPNIDMERLLRGISSL